jgi:uncharacterized protein YcaQ
MDELPHWRVVMHRERDGDYGDSRLRQIARDHAEAIDEMRAILAERGTVTNRDFAMATRTRTQSYRGRKDSALALYYLWYTGEVMTHHRENFERVYALTETVAPAHLIHDSDPATADRFLIQKEVGFAGLLAAGDLIEVRVEGWKAAHYALGSDAAIFDELCAGRVPAAWAPLETTTDEVVFLAPLDPVSARGRAKVLFGFDYVWEVYKPAPQRRFGYYALPLLWGERLVGRFDSKLDRTTNTFVILGLWLDDETLGHDPAFAEALAHGFARFRTFLGARTLDAQALAEPVLRRRVATAMEAP